MSGLCFFLGLSLISWHTLKHQTVSHFSSESEYRSLTCTTCKLQWLLYLHCNLKVECTCTLVLYCDNQSALYIIANLIFYKCKKHLEIDCHFIYEKKLAEVLHHLLPISSQAQLVNFFTKALYHKPFNALIRIRA